MCMYIIYIYIYFFFKTGHPTIVDGSGLLQLKRNELNECTVVSVFG